jgi:Ca2+-binding EF-hand superfamily protein
MLTKLNLAAPDKYLEALLLKFDRNGNGVVEFDEFLQYVVYDRYHKY